MQLQHCNCLNIGLNDVLLTLLMLIKWLVVVCPQKDSTLIVVIDMK